MNSLGRRWVFVVLGGLCLIWGSTWVVIQTGLEDVPPFTSAAARFVIAFLTFAAIAPFLAPREGGTRPSVRVSFAMGISNIWLSYAIVYWSETILPSGLVSLLWSVFPIVMALLGHWFLHGERIDARQWLGLGLGLAGITMLFLTDLRNLGRGAVPAGLVLLMSPLIAAIGQVFVKRWGSGASSVLLNRNAMAIGAIGLCATAFVFERPLDVVWTSSAIGSIVYLSLVGTVVAFGLYFWLLRTSPAYLLGLIAYVTPVIAVSLGVVVRDESVGRHTVAGGLTVLAGIVLVVRRRPAKSEEPSRHDET